MIRTCAVLQEPCHILFEAFFMSQEGVMIVNDGTNPVRVVEPNSEEYQRLRVSSDLWYALSLRFGVFSVLMHRLVCE
jgi:hypothetical protein